MRKQTGIKTFADIEIKDFTWFIKGVTYDWQSDIANVEVYAKETHYWHSRTFSFDCNEAWLPDRAETEIMKLEWAKGSEII